MTFPLVTEHAPPLVSSWTNPTAVPCDLHVRPGVTSPVFSRVIGGYVISEPMAKHLATVEAVLTIGDRMLKVFDE